MVSSTTPGKRFTHFVKISLLVRYHITTSPSQKRYEKRYERPELLRTFPATNAPATTPAPTATANIANIPKYAAI